MTFHDRRLPGVSRGARPQKTVKCLLDGASSISLWPRLKRPKLGSLADDWASVGEDIRKAMSDIKSGV